MWRQMEEVERSEESLEESHQQSEVDTIVELTVQFGNFQIDFVQMLVDERYERLKTAVEQLITERA